VKSLGRVGNWVMCSDISPDDKSVKAIARRAVGILAAIGVLVLVMAVAPTRSVNITHVSPVGATVSTATVPLASAVVAPELAGLKVMNYYPSNAAWNQMWSKWNAAQITSDFGVIKGLGANTVRLIIQPSAFGWPVPSAAPQAELAQAIAIAHTAGLRVQLTLFDLWGSYSDTAGSDRWADALLAPYKNDPRIAFVELQNEINPQSAAAMTWAIHEIPVVRAAMGTVPLTISTSGAAGVVGLVALKAHLAAAPPDFYDYHYYDRAENAYAVLSAAKAAASPEPLFIGEAGSQTVATSTTSLAASYAAQSLLFRDVEWSAQRLGLPPAAPWILRDVTPATGTGNAVNNADSYHFGLYTTGGGAKPAASVVRQFFTTGVVDTSINGGMETRDGSLPAGWSVGGGAGTMLWDNTVAHSGGASVKIGHTVSDPSEAPSVWTSPVVQPTHSGEVFTASVWVRGVNTTGESDLALAFYTQTGKYLGLDRTPMVHKASTTWSQLSVSAAAPAGATVVRIYLQSDANSGVIWFDDVAFTAAG
jgi:hypothetical protein